MSTYLVDGRCISTDSVELTGALGTAHLRRHRPLCLCRPPGLEMYVAQLGETFIVKRMPGTGSLHAPDCPSYEPPAEMSGLGRVPAMAITEFPDTGRTKLRLDFALSRSGREVTRSHSADRASGVTSIRRGLALRGLLHYLWDQAQLTRWEPGFEGRRSWSTVRRHLLIAAEGKIACGRPLSDVLYIPEVFLAEQRPAIAKRRTAWWERASRPTPKRRPLVLLLGEVKRITPARFGYMVVVRHLPDQPFALGDDLYRRMAVRFSQDLSLWGRSATLRMIILATFAVNGDCAPTLEELLLMPTNAQWIPVEDDYDVRLMDLLHRGGRRFTRCLRYNASATDLLPTAVLLDTSKPPTPLYVVRADRTAAYHNPSDPKIAKSWLWRPNESPIPPIPGASSPILRGLHSCIQTPTG